MSYTLAFWRGAPSDDPDAVYRALSNDEPVAGVETVDRSVIEVACERAFADWSRDGNLWSPEPAPDGNGPGFDLFIGDRLVVFTCSGLGGDQMNEIIDVMEPLGFPLYDPQTEERFDG